MSQQLTLEQARNLAPARMRERLASGTAFNKNFTEGVRDAYPMLSIMGKTFSIRAEGQTQVVRDGATGRAAQVLDVVFINASRLLAKTYYINAFDPNSEYAPPDCFSLDSVRPDASSRAIQNPTCQDCRWNVFGSAPSRDPTVKRAGKACQDFRRVVVTLPHLLSLPQAHLLMLRIPATSLKNMKAYVDKLAANGYEPGGCVSRLFFDEKEAYPKLEFEFVGPVNDNEFDRIVELATGPESAAMLAAPDFDNTTSPDQARQTPQEQQRPVSGQRQAPPDMGAGFGPGMMEQQAGQGAAAAFTQPVQEATFTHPVQEAKPAPAPVQQVESIRETWEDLGDGTELCLETGEVRAIRTIEEEIDPNVKVLSDGRFFNVATKKFVPDQYMQVEITKTRREEQTVAAEAPAQPKEPAKRQRAKKAPAAQPEQQAAPAAAPVAGNGHAEPVEEEQNETAGDVPKQDEKPMIVTASPKLEALLGGLASKRNDK